jgi:hypothetical protein
MEYALSGDSPSARCTAELPGANPLKNATRRSIKRFEMRMAWEKLPILSPFYSR